MLAHFSIALNLSEKEQLELVGGDAIRLVLSNQSSEECLNLLKTYINACTSISEERKVKLLKGDISVADVVYKEASGEIDDSSYPDQSASDSLEAVTDGDRGIPQVTQAHDDPIQLTGEAESYPESVFDHQA